MKVMTTGKQSMKTTRTGVSMKTSTITVAIALGILLFSNNLFAEEATAEDKQKYCISVSETAKVSAKAKYKGIPLSTLLTKIASLEEVPDNAIPILLAAYSLPDFTTPEYQQRTIREFADSVLVQCMKQIND